MRIIVPATHASKADHFAENQEILTVEPINHADGSVSFSNHWKGDEFLLREFCFQLMDYLEDCPLTIKP